MISRREYPEPVFDAAAARRRARNETIHVAHPQRCVETRQSAQADFVCSLRRIHSLCKADGNSPGRLLTPRPAAYGAAAATPAGQGSRTPAAGRTVGGELGTSP
jgi:hypothetical protein